MYCSWLLGQFRFVVTTDENILSLIRIIFFSGHSAFKIITLTRNDKQYVLLSLLPVRVLFLGSSRVSLWVCPSLRMVRFTSGKDENVPQQPFYCLVTLLTWSLVKARTRNADIVCRRIGERGTVEQFGLSYPVERTGGFYL